jgi:crossover junction endodeoxyribonuclease RuvC
MLVLGIDPGTATTGYGLIEYNNKICNAISWGLIETDKESILGKRLINIYKEISQLLKKYRPNEIAIEKIFFASNAKTAISIGQAQGVMLYSAARANINIFEYSPATIKKIISGNGRADKKVMQKSLRSVFGNKIRSQARKRTHFDNAADALAVALCHIYTINPAMKNSDNSVGGQ